MVTDESFQELQAKKNQRKIATPPTEHKNFRCPKDSETKRVSPTKFIGSIREKNSTEKSDVSIIGMNFFESLTFLIYQSVPQRNLSAPWDEKISTENRYIPFLCIHFFDTWHLKLSETLDGSSRSFSVLWDKKNSKVNRDMHKSFRDPNYSET